MSVTTSTPNFLTLIQENGSTPTGTGGAIIDTNFRRLDDQFSTSGEDILIKKAYSASMADYACSANFANSASYANSAGATNYAESACSANFANTASYAYSGTFAEFANKAGFATPAADYSSNGQPIAVWGSFSRAETSTVSESTYVINMPSYVGLPPFGPFTAKAIVCFYPESQTSSRIYADCMICGWNLGIDFVKILHAYKSDGTDTTVTIGGTDNNAPSLIASGNVLYFYVENNQLKCGATIEGVASYAHISVLSLYPRDTDPTSTYCCS